jgi:hypothetical protein
MCIAGVIPQSSRDFKWHPSAWVSQTVWLSYLSPPTYHCYIGKQHTISTFHADNSHRSAQVQDLLNTNLAVYRCDYFLY